MAEGRAVTQREVTFLPEPGVDEVIVGLAAKQHGVLSLAQFADLGLSGAGVRRRAANGRLHRIHRGVYSVAPLSILKREAHWMAAVLACGPGAVLSHRTAAALHEIRGTDRSKIDVTVPRETRRVDPKIDLHRSMTLTPADITVVNGIPCTTVARTYLDLAEVVSHRSLERALDQGEVMEVLDLRAIEDQLGRNPTRTGAGRVRRVLDEHYIGSTLTESELEEAMFAICRRAGIRLPEVNKWVDLGDGEPPIRADFLWRSERVILETDGRRFHDTHQRRERDPRRDQRAILAGWTPLRTTSRQVTRRPRELESMLRAVLAARAARG